MYQLEAFSKDNSGRFSNEQMGVSFSCRFQETSIFHCSEGMRRDSNARSIIFFVWLM